MIPKSIEQEDFAKLLVKYGVPAVSTTFGIFDLDITNYLKANGIKILVNCCNCAEAKLAASQGSDALILQGAEAGGHQGSFLTNKPNKLSSLTLLKQIKALNLNLPLIAAGGINLSNISAYWEAGANFVQLGTLFMLSNLSLLNAECLHYLVSQAPHVKTILTDALTGKWVRSIANPLTHLLSQSNYSFPIQHYATSYLRSEAKRNDNFDFAGLWLGEHPSYQIFLIEDLLKQLKAAYDEYSTKINTR
ncbi:nitronate monooxygenase [Legionella sp. D16C41]|uniref:nitronate monooxygenase n=1 Tax=Legionella sp. D16C41 TaxID=3402688 RepID=UPI003AF41159